MTWTDDAEFEPVVRDAMRARPDLPSISNLAFRAMELARAQARELAARQIEGWVRMRRRARWTGVVAAVLIAIVVWTGVRKASDAGGAATSAAANTTEQTSTDSNSSGSSTGAFSAGGALTAELLVVAIILLSTGIFWSRPGEGEIVFH